MTACPVCPVTPSPQFLVAIARPYRVCRVARGVAEGLETWVGGCDRVVKAPPSAIGSAPALPAKRGVPSLPPRCHNFVARRTWKARHWRRPARLLPVNTSSPLNAGSTTTTSTLLFLQGPACTLPSPPPA